MKTLYLSEYLHDKKKKIDNVIVEEYYIQTIVFLNSLPSVLGVYNIILHLQQVVAESYAPEAFSLFKLRGVIRR